MLSGGAGNDVIFGFEGADTIYGFAAGGDDPSDGIIDGNDRLYGEAGGDTIQGGPGDDLVAGGEGGDHFLWGDDPNFGEVDDGNDFVSGGPGQNGTLRGGAGNDQIFGGPDADNDLLGGSDNDFVSGGGGNDDDLSGSGRRRHRPRETGAMTPTWTAVPGTTRSQETMGATRSSAASATTR